MIETNKGRLQFIFKTYWPLALSWLFMAVDNPSVTAIISRMRDPENCLAAHGGVVYPIALIIESPVIMLISASIALCSDRSNYLRLRKLMIGMCIITASIQAMLSIPAIFNLVIREIVGAPEVLYPYIRTGIALMIPWSPAIAYRRFYQGILIRYGEPQQVTIGTIVRMISMFASLLIGLALRDYLTGALVAAVSLCIGVVMEALYAGWRGRKVVRKKLDVADSGEELISWKEIAAFTIPLCLTSLINLGWMSLGSAAMSRMLLPIASLAVWPALSGLLNILKSFGNAANETTLTVVLKPGYLGSMKRFVQYITVFSAALFVIVAFTPVNELWFGKISALTPELSTLCKNALPFAILVPLISGYLNYYQGILMAKKHTKGIFEALVVFLIVVLIFCGVGIALQRWQGIFVILAGMSAAVTMQMLWTAYRAKQALSGDPSIHSEIQEQR